MPDKAGKFKGISVPELPWKKPAKRDNAQPTGYLPIKK